jgi:ferredoxin
VDAIHPPYENKVKENRFVGVKRILRYMVFLPLMIIAGASVMYMLSDKFSKVDKEVKLYDMVMLNETQPQAVQSLELQAFYSRERTVTELAVQVDVIKMNFQIWSGIIGAFFCFVFSLTLINLSTKRTRKLYEIDSANCVGCGRCFKYCPQKLEK